MARIDMNAPPSKWHKFAREVGRSHGPRNDDLRFFDYAWEQFDRGIAIAILLERSPSYYGHKRILFAAFCAWMIDPADLKLRQAMIVKILIDVVGEVEMKIDELIGTKDGVGEFIVRLDKSFQGLYTDIYYPIGGILTISRIFDANIMSEYVKRAQYLLVTAEIMRCLHYISLPRFPRSRYLPPSVVRVSGVLASFKGEFRSKSLDKDNTRKQMDIRRTSASILYAFSSVDIADVPDNLLVTVASTFPDWNKTDPHFSKIVCRAQFVEDSVLSRTQIQTVERFSDAVEEIGDPALPEAMRNALEEAFLARGSAKKLRR